MKNKVNKENRLNKKFKITLIIFIITVIITLVLILGKGKIFGFRLIPVSETETAETHTIQLVSDSYYLSVEDGVTELYVTIDGNDVTGGYELVVSDTDVVSLEGNTVTALEEGVTTITAISTEYDIQSEITINVVEFVTRLVISSEYKTIDVGEQTQISYTTTPKDATVNVTYASSDETIATVDSNGIVTGVAEGSVSIIVTDEISGRTTSYTINVEE